MSDPVVGRITQLSNHGKIMTDYEKETKDLVRQFDEIMVRNGFVPEDGRFSDDDAAFAISKIVEAAVIAGHSELVPVVITGLIDAIRRHERGTSNRGS